MDSSYNRHSFQYDDLHRLTKANTNSSLWVKGEYEWDAMGNIVRTQLTEVIPDDGTEALAAGNPKKFRPANRPKSKKDLQRAGIQPLGRAVSFAYSGTTPVISNVTLNDLSRTVQHDVAGNETAYAITRAYSPRNLLASASDSFNAEDPALLHAIAYGYDGRGVRVSRTESPSNGPNTSARRYYVYTPELQLLSATRDDAENVWEPEAFPQPSFANNVHYEMIWFGTRPVAQFNPGSFTRFTLTDHLGTPLLQTDTAAEIAWRVEYEPFGSVYEVRNGLRTEQPLRFPGQELAMTWEGPEESFNIHRWYKSSWGRYTQFDFGWDKQVNPYSYVSGNPVAITDPMGLWQVLNKKPAPGTNTIVCDGKGGIEPWVQGTGNQLQTECFGDCIYLHELMHATDAFMSDPALCKGKAFGMIVTASNKQEQKASEQNAYIATIECLDSLKKSYTKHNDVPAAHKPHKGKSCPCIPTIDAALKQYKNEQKKVQ